MPEQQFAKLSGDECDVNQLLIVWDDQIVGLGVGVGVGGALDVTLPSPKKGGFAVVAHRMISASASTSAADEVILPSKSIGMHPRHAHITTLVDI